MATADETTKNHQPRRHAAASQLGDKAGREEPPSRTPSALCHQPAQTKWDLCRLWQIGCLDARGATPGKMRLAITAPVPELKAQPLLSSMLSKNT